MSKHSVLDRSSSASAPRLVEGTELIGEYQGSGYREPKYLIGRGDGQIIQLPELLYQLVVALDGQRDVDEVAAWLRAQTGRQISAEQVTLLLESKLRPAGIVAHEDGDGPALPVARPRPDPLLLLRSRVRVIPPKVVSLIATAFQPLYWPPVLIALLAAFVALDVTLVLTGAVGEVAAGAIAIAREPALALLVLGTVLASGVFHEFGHAAACRYGGARPGAMGVGIYLVWPAFYSTVTDSYRLSRGARLRTDLGGVYFNAVYIAGMSAAYLWTGAPWLLVAILVLHVETARQFLPSIRLDGYYILSDLIGLPDLFMFLRPVLKSVVPGRAPHPKLAELKPGIRWIIIAWVVLVVPFLLFFLALFLALAPQVLPVVWETLLQLLSAVAAAIRSGDTALATLDITRIFFLLLPIVGVGLLLGGLGRRIGRALVVPERRSPVPAADAATSRAVRSFLVAAVPVSLIGLLTLGAVDQLTTSVGESVLAAGAALGSGSLFGSVGWPDVVAVHQIAAVQGLLGDIAPTAIDSARAAFVVVNLVGCLLLFPVARRLGLSAWAAAVAVVLCGLPAPLVLLHASVDAGGLAAVWLAVAAAMVGRGRGATVAAGAAVVTAVLTAPLAATGVLLYGAHGMAAGQFAGGVRRWARRAGALLLAAAALAVAVRSTGGGPWTVSGAGMPSADLRGAIIAIGAPLLVVAWHRLRLPRPIVTGGAGLLVLVVVPGPHVTTALLLGLPVLALMVAALLEAVGAPSRPWWGGAVLAATLCVGIATTGPVLGAASALDPDTGRLSGWIRTQLEPTTTVQTDPLTAAELRHDGLSADRLRPVTTPAAPGAVTVIATRPGAQPTAPPQGTRLLMTVPDGPGGEYTEVYGADQADNAAERRRLGSQLAANRALTMDAPAAEALRSGQVDLRLVTVLSRLASAHDLRISAFPTVEGEPAAAPRRTVRITAVDDAPVTVPGAAAPVERLLTAQSSSLQPAERTLDRDALTLRYTVEAR